MFEKLVILYKVAYPDVYCFVSVAMLVCHMSRNNIKTFSLPLVYFCVDTTFDIPNLVVMSHSLSVVEIYF